MNLVRLYLEQNEEEKAWDCQRSATERNPNNEVALSILGQLSLRLNKYGDAAVAYERAVEKGDSRSETLSNLAYAYFMNGQTDKAVEIYEKLAHSGQGGTRGVQELIAQMSK